MNIHVRLLAVALVASCLAACTTSQPRLAQAPEAAPERGRSFGARESYMGHVEQVARGRGLEVHWVNPPDEALASE